MYTIDLLQGRGLPPRSRPGKVALALVPVLIPLLAGILMAASWKQTGTLIAAESQRLAQEAVQIDRRRPDLDTYRLIQQKTLEARHRLQGINKMLTTELPVSPILLELVRSLPDTIFFQDIELKFKPEIRQIQDRKTRKQQSFRVVQRDLMLHLVGPSRIESDQAVDGYIQALRANPVLSGIVREIRIVSRQPGKLDDRDQVFYQIDCQLKEQKSDAL